MNRARITACVVAIAFFMEQLDGTIIATALPQITVTFHAHVVDAGLGMTAYLIALAAFIPLSNWIADTIGARTTFCIAIALFTLASVACGIATSLPAFVVLRFLQGAAGAMMVPVGRTLVLRSSAKHELVRAMSYVTFPGLVAPVLGPPVGGLITTYLSWRWIFFLNVPIGIGCLILALILITPMARAPRRPFDTLGFVLMTAALVLAILGLDDLSRGDAVALGAALLAAGVVLGYWSWRHLGKTAAPIVDPAVARVPTFALANFAGGGWFRIAIQTQPFLLPLLFQVGLGRSAFSAGLLMLSYAAGNFAMKTVTTPLLQRFGFRTIILGNGALVALSLLACALIGAQTPDPVIWIVLFVAGLVRSMQYTAVNSLAFVDVVPAQMGAASTLSAMMNQVATALAVAVGALLLRCASLLLGTGKHLGAPVFHVAIGVVAAIALIATLQSFSLPVDAGLEVSRARPV